MEAGGVNDLAEVARGVAALVLSAHAHALKTTLFNLKLVAQRSSCFGPLIDVLPRPYIFFVCSRAYACARRPGVPLRLARMSGETLMSPACQAFGCTSPFCARFWSMPYGEHIGYQRYALQSVCCLLAGVCIRQFISQHCRTHSHPWRHSSEAYRQVPKFWTHQKIF